MTTKVEIDIDIDDVFSNLKTSEREEFIANNLDECDNQILSDYVIENNLISLDDFDEAKIVNYLTDKGYTIM